MSDVSPTGSISPENYKAYRKDFAKSADIMQKSLDMYNKTTEYNKKAQLKKTMNEAMTVMNQIVKVALKKNEQSMEKKLVKDYDKYINSENTKNYKAVRDDLDDLQDSVKS